jgi:antibiotic biosynthesis monooxygenase (ABM) superfamily enzyme
MPETDNHKPSVASPASPPPQPTVHLRAFVTWLVIFPLVAIGLTALGPFMTGWHPVLRAFVLTLIVVPLAVYILVPRVMRLVLRIVNALRR